METVAFRFSDSYAPKDGTIELHKNVIKSKGCVWYGVFGIGLSDKNINIVKNNPKKKIFLVRSKTLECYECDIIDIKKEIPEDLNLVPEYYRNALYRVKTWICIKSIKEIKNGFLDKAIIKSTNKRLIESISGGMTSCFIISID